MLARLGSLLLVGIFQLAQIENLGDRRNRIRGDLDKVETSLLSYRQRFLNGNFAAVLTFSIDELDTRNADVLIGAWTVLDGGGRFKRSANGCCLL